MIKIEVLKSYDGEADTGLGGNSVDLTSGPAFVAKASNIVTKATSSSVIAGVSLTQKAFASDNQTVAGLKVEYVPARVDNLYGVTISGGTITVADEGKFYNLTDSVTVDGTTESVTGVYTKTDDSGAAIDPTLNFQLQLVKFVSATYSMFRIVTVA